MLERNGMFFFYIIAFQRCQLIEQIFIFIIALRASLVATPNTAQYQDALAFTRSLGDLHLQTYGTYLFLIINSNM